MQTEQKVYISEKEAFSHFFAESDRFSARQACSLWHKPLPVQLKVPWNHEQLKCPDFAAVPKWADRTNPEQEHLPDVLVDFCLIYLPELTLREIDEKVRKSQLLDVREVLWNLQGLDPEMKVREGYRILSFTPVLKEHSIGEQDELMKQFEFRCRRADSLDLMAAAVSIFLVTGNFPIKKAHIDGQNIRCGVVWYRHMLLESPRPELGRVEPGNDARGPGLHGLYLERVVLDA